MHRKRHLAFPLATTDLGVDCITSFNGVSLLIFDFAWHDFRLGNAAVLKLQRSYFLNSLEIQRKEEDGVQKGHARNLRKNVDVIGITSLPMGTRRAPLPNQRIGV
jgi:hypothetical protein